MRTGKCRVWDKKHQCFLTERFPLFAPDGTIMLDANSPSVEPDRYVRQDYTDFTDKNGKDIYDGDLVNLNEDDEIYQVQWGHFSDCCVEGETWILGPIWQPTLWYYANDPEDNRVEIIGNMYEHPDLVRAEESEE